MDSEKVEPKEVPCDEALTPVALTPAAVEESCTPEEYRQVTGLLRGDLRTGRQRPKDVPMEQGAFD